MTVPCTARVLGLAVLGLGMLWGCDAVQPNEATLETYDCAGVDCIPCAQNDECSILHNPCQAVATCAHVDEPVAVTSEGCAESAMFATPSATDCQCLQSTCTALEIGLAN